MKFLKLEASNLNHWIKFNGQDGLKFSSNAYKRTSRGERKKRPKRDLIAAKNPGREEKGAIAKKKPEKGEKSTFPRLALVCFQASWEGLDPFRDFP